MILIVVALLLPAAVIGKDYFTAAVFEHRHPYANKTTTAAPSEVVASALATFEKATLQAVEKGVDIIVFNEYGISLYPYTRENFKNFAENVPDPRKRKFNPCIDETPGRPILHKLSCLARQNKIYLVANLQNVQPCDETCDAENIESCQTKCPKDDFYFYNTDVAFDREGNLIARYHKVHPFLEVVNVPDGPEFVTFDTEFGKFGMIVCFDSVWKEAVQLVEEYGIDTLLFPTFWFDDILPLNGVEWQQSWAIANKVNFLAANGHHPYLGTLGSGIFSKDGAVVYTYEPSDTSKLVIANLNVRGTSAPKENSVFTVTEEGVFPSVETGEMFPMHCYEKMVGPPEKNGDYRCYVSRLENYTLVKLEDSKDKAKACHNDFCCQLSYTADNIQEDFYLAAFSGSSNARGYHSWWEEVCLVVRCDPFEGRECATQPSRSNTIFQSAKLSAEFTSERIYPAVSYSQFRLAPKKSWNTQTTGQLTTLHYKPDAPKPLLKIALYGRKYSSDIPFIHDFEMFEKGFSELSGL